MKPTPEQHLLLAIASQGLGIPYLELEIDGTTIKHPQTGREWQTEWTEGKSE